MKYLYSAIFKALPDGSISISIPDLPGLFTQGKNYNDAIQMAKDAMAMWLCDAEDHRELTPTATEGSTFKIAYDETIELISVDTDVYRGSYHI